MTSEEFIGSLLAGVGAVDLPVDFDLSDDVDGQRGLVSVVIPTYNRAYVLRDTIRSALDQTYRNIEVIVVDDGSQDDTAAIVEEFGGRVRYFKQDNAGVCAARNLGLRESRGEYVALLDSDDQWLPWKLESQIRILERFPDVGMVWTDMVAVDESGKRLDEAYLRNFYSAHAKVRIDTVLEDAGTLEATWREAPVEVRDKRIYRGDLFQSMIQGNLVHTSTVVLRRTRLAAIGGFDLSLKRSGEDYEFHLRTTSIGAVAFLDASSILYRVGAADQLTAPKYAIDMARNNLWTVLRWLSTGRVKTDEAMRSRLMESFEWLGRTEFLAGDYGAARDHLGTSLQLGGVNLRSSAMYLFTYAPPRLFRGVSKIRRRLKRRVQAVTTD